MIDKTLIFPNPWMTISHWILLPTDHCAFINHKMDLLDTETNKVYSNWPYLYADVVAGKSKKVTLAWDSTNNPDNPWESKQLFQYVAKVQVRYHDKAFQNYHRVAKVIDVGDFVRCKSSSGGRYKWRKIIDINWAEHTIHGQCARQPIEDSLVFHSSENAIWTILEVVKGPRNTTKT